MEKPNIAQKKPFTQETEPGTYSWCTCGLSENQPFCDGTHTPTPFKPKVVKIESKKKIAWCGCKQTKNPPYCDGTHCDL